MFDALDFVRAWVWAEPTDRPRVLAKLINGYDQYAELTTPNDGLLIIAALPSREAVAIRLDADSTTIRVYADFDSAWEAEADRLW